MSKLSRIVLLSVTLFVGISIGVGVDAWRLETRVQANALDPATADALYRELGASSSTLVDGGRTLAKIASLTTPSVVHIQSERNSSGRGRVEETGSGVLMGGPDGTGVYVVTNRHVVASAELESISVHLHDGREMQPDRVWTDKATDVAVMKLTGANLQTARWADSDKIAIGHLVLAMGSPFGLSQSVTLGIISAKGRRSLKLGGSSDVLNQDFLQTDAAINPGNSGGPLIDMQGRVVGINTAIASSSGGNEGIGFSIPSNLVKRVVEQLLKHGRVQRAYLGVKLDPDFDDDTAKQLRLDRVRGARVVEVYPNTPASRSNVKFNDVILSFDGIDVQDENHLINLVSLTPVRQQVRIVVLRTGKKLDIVVTLEDRTQLDQRSEAPKPKVIEQGADIPELGLSLQQLDEKISEQLGHRRDARGLLVMNVSHASTQSSELALYDVIEHVAGQPVSTVDEFRVVLHTLGEAEPVLLKIRSANSGNSASRLVLWQRP